MSKKNRKSSWFHGKPCFQESWCQKEHGLIKSSQSVEVKWVISKVHLNFDGISWHEMEQEKYYLWFVKKKIVKCICLQSMFPSTRHYIFEHTTAIWGWSLCFSLSGSINATLMVSPAMLWGPFSASCSLYLLLYSIFCACRNNLTSSHELSCYFYSHGWQLHPLLRVLVFNPFA